jgi:hypothetical protein
MLKDVRNVRVGLGSLLPILVRSHWLLIPDPISGNKRVAGTKRIWDQSLMTVEINTITRVTRRVNCMSCNWRRHDHPRSIVTDHYLLDPLVPVNQ